MKIFTRLFRLMRINFVLMRYNIDEVILGAHAFFPLRVLIYFNPYYWTMDQSMTRGERIRRALEELGPIFVKAGQIISTRRDILPDDIANELAKLQDRVPPFPGEQARKMIEKSLGDTVNNSFLEFDNEALASASIAQVHAATLITGEKVVIKVLRPNIDKIIERDLDLLSSLATLAEKYISKARSFKPKQLVDEIAQTLHDELDLMREAANASQLRRNFMDSKYLYVPKVYWEYTRSNMLAIERIHGIPIHDIEKLQNAGISLTLLAERLIEVFFTQVFRDNYFHADLHPGNIFVDVSNPQDPSLIAVDFGIVGSLNQNDQRYIAENLLAFFKRDYQRVAELHIACGWLSPDTRIDQFEGAIRSVSEPIFERPLKDVSIGKLLLRLFQVARRFHINIQPQLILLQKTLLSVEGLSRQLAPDLDLWGSATPHIEKWLKRQVGVRSFFQRLRNNLPLWSEQLPEMPGLLYEVLKETKQKQAVERFAQTRLSNNHEQNRKVKRDYFFYGVMSALIIGVGVLVLFRDIYY